MTTLYYILCDYETWYHAREVFTVLALGYLVLRATSTFVPPPVLPLKPT